ncbi:MAG TPA: DoxX family protein [Candidatus Aquilonibacter sp.]|nr:DoxX family protein [Candidatus Aquilonibacter sp.]
MKVAAKNISRGTVAGFWISTALFCLEMSFTAYYELANAGVGENFARLGFSNHAFHVELSVAKILGVLALLIPLAPARLKEWAYAGFAINLISALIAHLSMGDRTAALVPSAATSVLWALSYFFWRRLQSNAGEHPAG